MPFTSFWPTNWISHKSFNFRPVSENKNAQKTCDMHRCRWVGWLAFLLNDTRWAPDWQFVQFFPFFSCCHGCGTPSPHPPSPSPMSSSWHYRVFIFLHIIIFYASWLLDTAPVLVWSFIFVLFFLSWSFLPATKSCCHVQINKRVTDKKVIYYFIHIWQINLMTLCRLTLAH